MRPRFRSDLQCSREEQQGVVFYRVDDPKSQTSFRLYEIEYLIAQKLDGGRGLAEVIKAVKDEYNFDISEPDLQKFVGQLESMGFIEKEPGSGLSTVEAETQAMRRNEVASDGVDEVADADLLEVSTPAVDEAELKRLVKSALLHVRQGYIVHARDYFLAAKELNPSDPRLAKLVSHLEIIGDASGPAEVDYLWNQSRELFPEIAEEIGPVAEARSGASGVDSGGRRVRKGDDDLRGRLLWTALAVLVLGGGGGGLWYFAKVSRIFEGAAKASITKLKSQRIPIYYEGAAESVRAARETWLTYASGGKVADVSTDVGTRVQADQTLVALELAPALAKQMAAARAAAKKAEGEYKKTASKLENLLKEREAVEAERDAIDQKLEELKSKNQQGQAGAAKRDLERYKKAKAKVNKTLSALAKREQKPRAAEVKSRQKLAQARQRVQALERQSAQKMIRAPFAGLVVDLPTKKGQSVKRDQKAVLLRDNLEARLSFVVKEAGTLASGGEAFVSVAKGVASRAKVAAVQSAEGGKRIEVVLVDPAGSFVEMSPSEFRLVREFAEPAFEIPTSALVTDARGAHVLVELQGRALLRDIEVLNRDTVKAVIRDRSGTLRTDTNLIVDRIGEGGVASIADGSFVEVQN